MPDASDTKSFPLTEVPEHVASRPSIATVRRWARLGVRGVRLRTWLVGGRRHTSDAAIAEFMAQLNGEVRGM